MVVKMDGPVHSMRTMVILMKYMNGNVSLFYWDHTAESEDHLKSLQRSLTLFHQITFEEDLKDLRGSFGLKDKPLAVRKIKKKIEKTTRKKSAKPLA